MSEDTRGIKKEQAADKLASAAFVLGIISLFATFCCCPFVFSAIGIILALLSKGAEQALRPKARTGLILSIIGMAVSLILSIFLIAFPIFMMKTNPLFKQEIINEMQKQIEMNKDLYEKAYGEDFVEDFEDYLNEAF